MLASDLTILPASDAEWSHLLRLLPGYDPFKFDPIHALRFDAAAATRAIRIFHTMLKHVEGAMAGKPFILQRWQQAFIGNLFGWMRPDGSRRYRETLLYCPRKQGKSPLCAGIGVLMTCADGEAGAQNHIAAADAEQAAVVFRHAAGMVDQDKVLRERCKIYRGTAQRAIVFENKVGSDSVLRVVSSVADTKHGGNAHLTIIDELHVQPNRELVETLRTSHASANRRQPLLVFLTTADTLGESICNETYDYACKVRDGHVDDWAFLPVIYDTPQGADFMDERVWERCNPNLDVSVSRDYLRREAARAKETPAYQNEFCRLHLNMQTEVGSRWLSTAAWAESSGEPVTKETLRGLPCAGGLDLSAVRDLTAFVLMASDGNEGAIMLPFFWCPEAEADKRERLDRVPYRTWARQGFIRLIPGPVIAKQQVAREVIDICGEYDVSHVACDPWMAGEVMEKLSGSGITVVKFGQTFANFTAPTKTFEQLVAQGKLRHGGDNPVLNWMIGNVRIRRDQADNYMPVKHRSTGRIDGIVAGIMAIDTMQQYATVGDVGMVAW